MYKKWIEGKKVVCFDLDGTIVDTVAPSIMAFQRILHLANPDLRLQDVYGQVGEPIYEKWARVVNAKVVKNNMSIKELTDNTHKEFIKIISENPLEPKAGFWDLIYKLKEDKKLPIALATNSEKGIASLIINKAEIANVFDFIIYGDEVKRPKPNPEIYHLVAQHYGIKAQEMLVFEDSIVGVQAADKAGASYVVIWDGQTMKSSFPDKALAFTLNFEGIADGLDYTVDEALENLKKASEQNPQNQS